MCSTCSTEPVIISRQFTSLVKDQANMVTAILVSGHMAGVKELSAMELESAVSRVWRVTAEESK